MVSYIWTIDMTHLRNWKTQNGIFYASGRDTKPNANTKSIGRVSQVVKGISHDLGGEHIRFAGNPIQHEIHVESYYPLN